MKGRDVGLRFCRFPPNHHGQDGAVSPELEEGVPGRPDVPLDPSGPAYSTVPDPRGGDGEHGIRVLSTELTPGIDDMRAHGRIKWNVDARQEPARLVGQKDSQRHPAVYGVDGEPQPDALVGSETAGPNLDGSPRRAGVRVQTEARTERDKTDRDVLWPVVHVKLI